MGLKATLSAAIHAAPAVHRGNDGGDEASAESITLHDVQALIVHLARTNARPAELDAWLTTWGHMLALRQAHWPMAQLTLRQCRQWRAWAQAQPDSPCVAVCSTAQGDAICRGCRRSFDEIAQWPAMSLPAKRRVWARLLAGNEGE